MVGENVKTLRDIRKKGGSRYEALLKLVPPTTLRRHMAGKEVPSAEWIIRYDLALGMRASDWLSSGAFRKEAKRTHSLAYADVLKSNEGSVPNA